MTHKRVLQEPESALITSTVEKGEVPTHFENRAMFTRAMAYSAWLLIKITHFQFRHTSQNECNKWLTILK